MKQIGQAYIEAECVKATTSTSPVYTNAISVRTLSNFDAIIGREPQTCFQYVAGWVITVLLSVAIAFAVAIGFSMLVGAA